VRARSRGRVESIERERRGAQELTVRVGEELRAAVAYTALTGPAAVGDTVVLNTWAVELGLGTGGVDFVCAIEGRELEADAPGHLMKLRYTPLQFPVLTAASPESLHHDALGRFVSLRSVPVVCAELHSQVPAIAAAARWETRGKAKIAYIMTDSAALPIAFSRLVDEMRERELIDVTITAGQAFGGDIEAVNVYSALAAARVVARADVIIVAQGPGNAGTDTALGFSGIDQGIALNAVASLDGTAIAAARLSFSDPRPRHVGLSHHTRTILERICLRPVLVPIPRLSGVERHYLTQCLEETELSERHEFITVEAEGGFQALIDCGIDVTTMGRSIQEDRTFFMSAAAAGQLGGQWVNALTHAGER
jgi:hypothetical protein